MPEVETKRDQTDPAQGVQAKRRVNPPVALKRMPRMLMAKPRAKVGSISQAEY